VLRKDKQVVEDKNRRNYATEKWEQDLRAELAAKRAAQEKKPRMTRDEIALVETQRQRESEIRRSVQSISERLERGLNVLEAIIEGDASAAHEHLPRIQALLLEVAKSSQHLNGYGWLAGPRAVQVYITLAGDCTDPVDAYAHPMAAAILRHRQIDVPQNWSQEPLMEQTVRCMTALYEMLTDDMLDAEPVSPQTFAFCFALIESIVNESVKCQKEEYVAMLEMIVKLVEMHADLGGDEALPRQSMIQCMLALIDKFPKVAKAAQVCFSFKG
jgi:hypothetical protein